ncbi:LPS-assembly protein LptD [Salipiger sp. IMCC34102]|uniref:LPS-assembly protein LptD n=1 Tax=Salipiger sp. IMCC34102 TaxID=2510647 RepID=UPI00101BCD98|nr:LPS assembly protein LptD [Salipiger sp. IMCC34102]RYH03213.1 LPS-assembly protein LptD [Salipiger sp. IMCC34102]
MRGLALWLILTVLPLAATAQMAATLVADRVDVTADSRLIATGGVEALYQGTRLRAERITYDRTTDKLTIEGPILITDPDGQILTAESARLDPQFETGLLLGARLVLDQQLQLAANRIDRVDGRFSQLSQTAVTSCAVCGGRAPLWSIRADRVLLDDAEEMLYLERVRFRVKDVPIAYLPSLRLPTPSNGRATGLLTPRFTTSDLLGPGLRLPYFITIGPSRDLTLTPFISRETRTLEARYRQAFGRGGIDIQTAVTQDDLRGGPDLRGFTTATGTFRVAEDYDLSFDLQYASDDAYLSDYNISDTDRLASVIALTRVDEDSVFSISGSNYSSLRENEVTSSLPPVVLTGGVLRQFERLGGTLTLAASGDTLLRYADDRDDFERDQGRLGASAYYSTRRVTDAGLSASMTVGVRADAFRIENEMGGPDTSLGRIAPSARAVLRYPLARISSGSRNLIEPVLAISYSEAFGETPPNEDSLRQEFDEGNLTTLTQLPGEDAVQTGGRAALGITWTRTGGEGVTSALTFGRVFQQEVQQDFTRSSGLDHARSDWLVAAQLELPRGLTFDGRALIDDEGETSLSTARVYWDRPEVQLAAAYIFQRADPRIDRPEDISEYSFDGAVRVSPAWDVSFDARYDLGQDAAVEAGLGVGWTNECVNLALSVSRRFASSTTLQPSTDYGLSVELLGFSARSDGVRSQARCDS